MGNRIDDLHLSKFRLYCIGTVAMDLIKGNPPLKIYPHEIMANWTGELEEEVQVNKIVKDSEGKAFQVVIAETKCLMATWLPDDTNRVTPPNVRKGEKVEVYQYGDSNKFYWRKLGIEVDLRELEHVTHVYVNIPDPGPREVGPKKSYWHTISTLNKVLHLHTSDNDKEFTTYDIRIDTKNGHLIILDGRKNFLELNSKTDTWTIKANKDINLSAGNKIHLSAPTIVHSGGTTLLATNETKGNIIGCTTLKAKDVYGNQFGPMPMSASYSTNYSPNPVYTPSY